ncbi:flagellar motor protein MotB [Pleionea sp. CnH1-48]|uniref:flagellar motor protein MotB n=1 Tax=Pleionea sp. CnH1-48 TaxID=2954494 RepID=UPI0020976C6B|nr:flagellar motor protein MotB [Pleionea sp. CnH1-48]MCO7226687.1 flagellar motor protein MotB [Pleionea sp. CnH1-48]
MSDEEECNCPPEGLPAYMGTFADLMSLLMCFFVLLLAFSEMDVLKFKQIAGSMKYAFGVQNKVEVKDIPKGTSVIAQEFSPGKPTPTMIESIMQHTVEITKETLDFDEATEEEPDQGEGSETNTGMGESSDVGEGEQAAIEEAEELAKDIAKKMSQELASGQVELLTNGKLVVIRIRENGSFGSGSARIKRTFLPVINKIKNILLETDGEVRVAGHTDNIPIDTDRFRSNWELSGGRAGSVVRELLRSGELERDRFVITGYADTKPLADNASADGRAKNRRVEIVIVQGDPPPSQVLDVDKEETTEEEN